MDDTKRNNISRRLKELKEDYQYQEPSIFEEDSTATIAKYIITNELNDVDRTIIYLYADAGNLRDLGKKLGCSHSTIRPEVNRIKNYIQKRIKELRPLF